MSINPSQGSFFKALTKRGGDDEDDDSDGAIVMTGPGVYTSGSSNVDLIMNGAGSSMTSSGGDIFSSSESNPQSVVVPAPPSLMAFPPTTISSVESHYPSFPAVAPQEVKTPQRRSSSPVSEFIKRTSSRIFGRNRGNSSPSQPSTQDLDPSKMSVPELFAALSSLPPSKFDKIADQLISESLGMGSFMAPPPGFFSGGITGGLGPISAASSLIPSASSLIPSLSFPGSSSGLLGGRGGGILSSLAASSPLSLRSRLPLPGSGLISSVGKPSQPTTPNINQLQQNNIATSSSNVRPTTLIPPPPAVSSPSFSASSVAPNAFPPVPQIPYSTVVFPVYVSKDTPLPAISKEASKLAEASSSSQASPSVTSPFRLVLRLI